MKKEDLIQKEILQAPRGTKDILPGEQKYWRKVEEVFRSRCEKMGFNEITLPLFEYKELFTKSIGEETEIVEKQMFEVRHLSSTETESTLAESPPIMVLRPEGTASVVRAYIEHGMHLWPTPICLYYLGPMFRYERPQKGRLRQHYQYGAELIGDASPLSDALVILLAWQIYMDLGIKDDLIIKINSIGCKNCRGKIKKTITNYYQKYTTKYTTSLCPDCQRRFFTNPLRLLDCKQDSCQPFISNAPQLVDSLCLECSEHFRAVLEALDDLGLPYDLSPSLVRGLDYYTKTVFEFRSTTEGGIDLAIGGGGRYDELIEMFGQKSTPAIGFAGGFERTIELIKEKKIKIPEIIPPDVFVIQLGEKAKKKSLLLVALLGEKGIGAACFPGKESLKSQLKIADKIGTPFTIIIGQREVLDGTVLLRDMKEGSQEVIPQDQLIEILKKKLWA